MFIEITREAFWSLVGNDEVSWRDYKSFELTEESHYFSLGVNLKTVTNFAREVTQYYVADINS